MKNIRRAPEPPASVVCEHCGVTFLRYQSEIRKRPSGALFCTTECSRNGRRSPLTTCGIYAIVHRPTSRLYIGSSANMTRRWNYHRSALRAGRHENWPLQDAWKNGAEDEFTIQALELTEPMDMESAEQRWLDKSRPTGLLFNLAPNAGSTLGVKLSTEVSRAISGRQTGRTLSPETRAKISAAHLGKSTGRTSFGLEHRSLTIEQATDIKRRLAECAYPAQVAHDTGTAGYTVSRIAKGKIYFDVCPELNPIILNRLGDGRRQRHAATAVGDE